MATRTTKKRSAKPGARRADPATRRPAQQDRGQKRIEELLDAAEAVIVESGVDGMTTNAVAERAGAGMGSLYHFFASKEAILGALAERYMGVMRSLTAYEGRAELRTLPLATLADAIVDPLAEFFRRTPAYSHVFHAIDRPGARDRACGELHEAASAQVESIIAARAPHLDPKRRRVHAMAAVEMVHALLTAAFAGPAAQRAPLIAETKRLLALHAEMIEKGDEPLERLR
ncbi:MAG: TetR family transcriptional regulator [Candidatus Eisenbacteria bacterium]|jgi:AcrR family transcriptional regulator|nr:TetR family transcriptional regulator [Candidatus Eisenbacteria bacterium]